ncbi:glycosyltransferase family 4 protein [Jannaschia sp. Os4]|uniref:glycosyltransferase family 4 protein n=1 Tax=Jannaschia sp. Os4 TaxID=2807617 RepID=UPI0019397072|nr:glycosyltransferase family 4 protein [Jannaschia sp. Os4]MBM2575428.1 glycosyltransferase family 4 protein [Jannaschia sp. Os4]
MTELVVTNLDRRYTGVSATSAAVVRLQAARHAMVLAGHPLPGCPDPVTLTEARTLTRSPPEGRRAAIWHTRRAAEMRAGLVARDLLGLPIRLVHTVAAPRPGSPLDRWMLRRMDALIATTPEAADLLPRPATVVPHGIDTERWRPAADRAAAWGQTGHGGARGIACVGGIRGQKGTDRFVEACVEVLPRHPDVTALVIGGVAPGDAAFAEKLRETVRAAGLGGRILFLGEVPSERMPDLVRGLDLLVALPRYEGFGVAPLEAMASGVPFLATAAGHYREIAHDGTAGRIVARDAAAGALDAMLSDPAALAAMGATARARAVADHGVAAEVAGIERVYEAVWAGRSARARSAS